MALGVEFPKVTFQLLFPIIFLTYVSRHGISFHNNADDTQLYFSVCPDDTDIKSLMVANFLPLNQDKTK